MLYLLELISLEVRLYLVGLFRNSILRTGLTLIFEWYVLPFSNLISTMIVTDLLKVFVGRPRPYFAAACTAYVSGSFSQCTGDPATVAEARKSFPSGHSSLAFSAAIYVACYLSSVLGVGVACDAQTRSAPRAWKIPVLLLFPLSACFVAASRTVDYHHNYADVVAGSLLGTAIAVVVAQNRLPDISAMRDEFVGEVPREGRLTNSYETVEQSPV